jgi:hypothetical protein
MLNNGYNQLWPNATFIEVCISMDDTDLRVWYKFLLLTVQNKTVRTRTSETCIEEQMSLRGATSLEIT